MLRDEAVFVTDQSLAYFFAGGLTVFPSVTETTFETRVRG